jgi:hypothetical protein
MLAVVFDSAVAMLGLRLMWLVQVQSTVPPAPMVMLSVDPLGVALVPVPVTVPHARLFNAQPALFCPAVRFSVTEDTPAGTPLWVWVPPLDKLNVDGVSPPVVV